MKRTRQLFLLGLQPILIVTLLLVLSPCAGAQSASDTASPGNAESVSQSASPQASSPEVPQTQAPDDNGGAATQSAGLTTARTAGNTCDLVSGPLECIADVFRDQRGIWTAPARLRGRKLLWLAPFATATALAFAYDVRAMNALGPSPTRIRISNDFTHLGSAYALIPAAGLSYLIGKLDHKEGPREAGVLALESIADAGLVMEGLKLATNRQRPYVPPGTGKFWPDDTDVYSFSSSFPSGHAMTAWAFARVMVEETPGHRWLHVALYGLATGVAIARVTGENHFPSDALVGSVLGYSIGGYVYHHHSAFYTPKTKSLRIEPLYNPATASYGVSLAIRP